jgi:murein DD-endopeptidase MepM/ murein hydrolase activator NlpD
MSSKVQLNPSKSSASGMRSNRKPAFETITYKPSPATLSAPTPTESGHKVSITELPPPEKQARLAPSLSKPTQPVHRREPHESGFGLKPEEVPPSSQAQNPLEVIHSLGEENPSAGTEPRVQAEPAIVIPESTEPISVPKPSATPQMNAVQAPPSSTNMGGLSFVWPLIGATVAPFGSTADGLHNDGINIKARKGSPVRAAESGTVVFVGEKVKGFGQLLLIKHKNNFTTAYAHTQKILVKKKDTVKRGQVVAYSGDSGSVKFPQLHFELRSGVKPIDPTPYLAQQ